jgi:hypothetical protein
MILKIRVDIIMKLIISFLAAFLIIVIPNYQYLVYHAMAPLTTQDMEERSSYKSIGYPAAEDIFHAENIEDIKNNFTFTMMIDRSDLTPTGYYKILDASETGYQYGTGRYSHTTYISMYKEGNIFTPLNNKLGPAYGQYYVLDLNGEKVIVYLDPALLQKGDNIRLPIGTVVTSYPVEYFEKIQTKYDVPEENSDFYVDMAGSNWVQSPQLEELGLIQFAGFILVVVVTYVISSKWLKHTDVGVS